MNGAWPSAMVVEKDVVGLSAFSVVGLSEGRCRDVVGLSAMVLKLIFLMHCIHHCKWGLLLCLYIYLLLCFSFYFCFLFCGVVVLYARDCLCGYIM